MAILRPQSTVSLASRPAALRGRLTRPAWGLLAWMPARALGDCSQRTASMQRSGTDGVSWRFRGKVVVDRRDATLEQVAQRQSQLVQLGDRSDSECIVAAWQVCLRDRNTQPAGFVKVGH